MKRICVFGIIALLASACSDKVDHAEEARSNALDLAGMYTASTFTGSDMDLRFQIANESNKNDVMVKLERSNGLTKKENDFFEKKMHLDLATAKKLVGGTLVLGAGPNDTEGGGENVSHDNGESSRLTVCSEGLRYDSSRIITVCLSGLYKKVDHQMRGRLETEVATFDSTTDSTGKHETIGREKVTVRFIAASGQ